MSIGIIAKLKCAEGKNAEFEAGFKEMQKAVSENEPGCEFYLLHKSRSEDIVYYVMEQYSDEEALSAHGKSNAFKAAGAKLGPYSGGKAEIELMDLVS
ncbi:MAG: antibiotic biosynthesis monooxygenase [Gammaproteobacteria bacterium]|uniref:Antibiotic biosynthesis monooxygenase n=1 Tax=OM182 bacterium MED-G24 TaxID=1986255 RepID=A0A2A5X032_9GAMM|nr:antibiotic biosynthesis monooxygenase [Gammaproteobacteria bacterium]PDH41676.1 MAG: antibiotic biosynthesis monooxygenase [OM182 bacterium MED-G24]RPG26658.1 MAG: antibiotic biosynthesis monooxygenase [Gammaproteobacteria bacterium TMED50]|tara:strand:+ start:212 stop:505 length:294 start_codon:yes stop_codon:yes gene_type:complete